MSSKYKNADEMFLKESAPVFYSHVSQSQDYCYGYLYRDAERTEKVPNEEFEAAFARGCLIHNVHPTSDDFRNVVFHPDMLEIQNSGLGPGSPMFVMKAYNINNYQAPWVKFFPAEYNGDDIPEGN